MHLDRLQEELLEAYGKKIEDETGKKSKPKEKNLGL